MKLKRKILTVKEFMSLVLINSPILDVTFIETHKVESGKTYKRCECRAATVTNLDVVMKRGKCLKWSDFDGDPIICITDYDMLIDKATYDGEWLTTIYQNIPDGKKAT
jgi:hypothetical protein